MASRPLPPGRRGRGPRVASGLHNLPEPKLLDVPAASHSNSSELHSTETLVGPLATTEALVGPLATTEAPPSTTASATTAMSPVHAYAPPPVAHRFATVEPVAEPPSPVTSSVAADAAPVKHRVEHVVAALEERSGGHVSSHGALHRNAPSAPMSRREPAAAAVQETPKPATAPPAPPSQPPLTTADSSTHVDPLHPFALLLPVAAVPEVPESVACLFDADAAAMQKCVLKTARKLLSRAALDDFKINARLFGNSFMEPREFLESLVSAFGAVRALQFVPSLLTLQSDYMKRAGLLLAARNYRLRNLAALEAQVTAMQAKASVPSASVAPMAAPVAAPVAASVAAPMAAPLAAPVAAATPVAAAMSEPSSSSSSSEVEPEMTVATKTAPVVTALDATEPSEDDDSDNVHDAADAAEFVAAAADQVAEAASDAATHAPRAADESVSTATAVAALVGAVAPPAEHVAARDAVERHAAPSAAAATTGEYEDAHTAAAVDAEPSTAPVCEPPAAEHVPPPSPVQRHTPAPEPPAFSVSDLPLAFQQAFASSPLSSPMHRVRSPPPAQSAQPVNAMGSSSSSVAEAENLFGERFSADDTTSDSPETLFGERIDHSVPATDSATSPLRASAAATATNAPTPVHAQLLFGFATAGADSDDSDSDDSGFSSS